MVMHGLNIMRKCYYNNFFCSVDKSEVLKNVECIYLGLPCLVNYFLGQTNFMFYFCPIFEANIGCNYSYRYSKMEKRTQKILIVFYGKIWLSDITTAYGITNSQFFGYLTVIL